MAQLNAKQFPETFFREKGLVASWYWLRIAFGRDHA
jgi:hypothetical protein